MPGKPRFLQTATAAYAAPFAAFVGIMGLERLVPLPATWLYPLRFTLVLLLLAWVSRRVFPLRVSAPLASVVVGLAVFLIWIGPDVLFGPGYRRHWLFDNQFMGSPVSSAPEGLKHNLGFMLIRTLGCVALVPVVEELFWRGWLMRWLVDNNFEKVPLGAYAPSAFWTVAVLFASEHGPFWEVGLAAGIVYNWWMVRTRNLADCILAHAVTNGLLSAYVLLTGQWQYWL